MNALKVDDVYYFSLSGEDILEIQIQIIHPQNWLIYVIIT